MKLSADSPSPSLFPNGKRSWFGAVKMLAQFSADSQLTGLLSPGWWIKGANTGTEDFLPLFSCSVVFSLG